MICALYSDDDACADGEENLVDALLSCPRFDEPFDMERDHRDTGRED